MIGQFLTVLACSTAYAVMRYAAFGGVSLTHLPSYLLNKSMALAAVASLFLAALGFASAQRDRYLFWSRCCTQLMSVHVLLSLGLWSRAYYGKLFEADQMNLTGEAVLLMGVLAVYCLWRPFDEVTPAARHTLTVLACALVAGHNFFMGFGGWLQVQKWHGGLPPITLIGFCLALFSLLSFLRVKATSAAATGN